MTKLPASSIATDACTWSFAVVVLTRNGLPLGHAGGVVSLGVDAPAVAVLVLAGPGDNEVAARIGCHRARAAEVIRRPAVEFAVQRRLPIGGRCVDADFAARGNRRARRPTERDRAVGRRQRHLNLPGGQVHVTDRYQVAVATGENQRCVLARTLSRPARVLSGASFTFVTVTAMACVSVSAPSLTCTITS